MRVIRKIGLLSLLFVLTLFLQNAPATLTHLPESSHHRGSVSFNIIEYDITGHIDFAVYDTGNIADETSDEFAFVQQLELPGRYVYAYQVFNISESADGIEEFSVFGLDDLPLDAFEESISSEDDEHDGIEPSDEDFSDDMKKGIWTFELGNGGLIVGDEHSWFLVYSSDRDWVEGTYELKVKEQDEFPVPPGIPEPATLALLGIGTIVLLRNRRKPV